MLIQNQIGEKRLRRITKCLLYICFAGAVMNIYTRDGDSPIYLSTFGILNSPYVDPDVLTDLSQAGEYNQ